MPGFSKGPGLRTPFGKNVFLRSTRDVKHDSFTFAASTMPTAMVDGTPQKVLQPGVVVARITEGPEAGKIGPFHLFEADGISEGVDSGATDGRGDPDNIVGINDTFLPWQLLERDVEVAVIYEAAVVAANVLELDPGAESDGEEAFTALSQVTIASLEGRSDLHILFR